jgi:hypothetical protein
MDNTIGSNLYDLLVTKDFSPELLDTSGKTVTDPNQAELFSFDWKTENKNYGTVVILLNQDNGLEIYFGDNLGRTMEGNDKNEWYEFLAQIKNFSTRNMLTFEINNINRLKYTMQGMSAIKEGLFEGYYGRKNISYSDQPKKTRLMIKHSRDLGEGEARYRAIESLFVETADGERFRVPSRSLMHGKMLARHIAEGGTPYDALGRYMGQIVSEINTLGRFIRVAKNQRFDPAAQHMIESAIKHYADLKAKAKRMISQRGYVEERDSYDPAEISDHESMVEDIRELFVQQTLDDRIEEALPILSRLSQKTKPMQEVQNFESWADNLVEGTWALPEGPEAIARLQELMANPLPVGPDATNATEQLYDLLGDDQLFDRLSELASTDANADARPAIQQRLRELGMANILDTKQTADGPDMQEDLDVDGIMMTRPSNMSS